jgi:hypothetical protein
VLTRVVLARTLSPTTAPSTGPLSVALTRHSATVTWSVPARLPTPSRSHRRTTKGRGPALLHQRRSAAPVAMNPAEGGRETPGVSRRRRRSRRQRDRIRRVPRRDRGVHEGYSWRATGRLSKPARCRGSSITTVLLSSAESVRAATAIDMTSPRFTARCGAPGGM